MASGAYDKNDQFIFIGLGAEDYPDYADIDKPDPSEYILCVYCEHNICVCGGWMNKLIKAVAKCLYTSTRTSR